MTLRSRLDRLERERGQQGGCNACQGAGIAFAYDDGTGEGPRPAPAPCEQCGAEPAIIIEFTYEAAEGAEV